MLDPRCERQHRELRAQSRLQRARLAVGLIGAAKIDGQRQNRTLRLLSRD